MIEAQKIGRYEILKEKGRGAMGTVYIARDPAMDRIVALKTIHSIALTGPQANEFRERFYREARSGSLSDHAPVLAFLPHRRIMRGNSMRVIFHRRMTQALNIILLLIACAALLQAGAGGARLKLRGQACTETICKNIDVTIGLPLADAGTNASVSGLDLKRLVQVR